ncbi:unnamed protein product [Linum trigynum]|uniref:RNase H type-1 domain-containing protein n=1 Tax=Linum trigynum TaxID=586398 RepID=A0AAV2D5G9_9ROSI
MEEPQKSWSDRWLDDNTILKDNAPNLPMELLDMPVIEFVLNGKWNSYFLLYYLPHDVVSQINLHPVPVEDARAWRFNPNGEFTLRSAYELTDNTAEPKVGQQAWRSVWKAPTLQRVRAFLCLMNHGRLLTNAERARRHLTNDTSCKICGGGPEMNLHIVRDCPFARATWADLLEDEPDSRFLETDGQRWSLYYLSGRSNTIDATMFAGTCWLLWKNRNDFVFQDKLKTHTQIQFNSRQLRDEIINALDQEKTVFVTGGTREQRQIGWQPPKQDWVCVNTDGSVIHSPESTSCGGIIRGSDGRFVRAYTANLGGGSITRAELAGIVYGLDLAWEQGARKVLLQTDSVTAKTLIENATEQHMHYSQISEIRRRLQRDWTVRIDHIFREANFATDHLASIGHSQTIGVHVMDRPCTSLLYWLFFDQVGSETPRFVRMQ